MATDKLVDFDHVTDYISRETAIEKITALINKSGKYTAYESGAEDACYIVEHDIPTADMRPVVHGKWIRRSDDSCVATCSVCGEENQYAFCIMSLDEQSLVQQDMFCPKCGADMREVQSNG